MPLLLAFILVPLIEIALFIQIGDVIGLWWTLATVVVTAIAGASLVRRQGADILARLQASMETLRDPTTPLAEGAMVLFSGALLLTPGFFTDFIGFALLVPGVRHAIIRQVGQRMAARGAGFHAHGAGRPSDFGAQQGPYRDPERAGPRRPHHPPRSGPHRPRGDDVIEGDYEVAPEEDEKKKPSGWTRH
jgi:UPF0716 protein FxsA